MRLLAPAFQKVLHFLPILRSQTRLLLKLETKQELEAGLLPEHTLFKF